MLVQQLNQSVFDADTGENLGLLKDVDTNLAATITYEDFCAAFPTFIDGETAQEYFDGRANAQEQAILDPDANGVACDSADPADPGSGGDQYTPPEVEPEAIPEPEAMPEETPDDTGILPDTGGPALLLPAAGLLLATGLIGLTVVRRRS